MTLILTLITKEYIFTELSKYSFYHCGHWEIAPQNSHLTFIANKGTQSDEDYVYCWVLIKEDKLAAIVYVGKAGRTILIRMRQHEQGFRSDSRVGSKKNKIIKNWLSKGYKLEVFSRKAKDYEICDETVSGFSIEEEAFIQKWKQPLLNNRIDEKTEDVLLVYP